MHLFIIDILSIFTKVAEGFFDGVMMALYIRFYVDVVLPNMVSRVHELCSVRSIGVLQHLVIVSSVLLSEFSLRHIPNFS